MIKSKIQKNDKIKNPKKNDDKIQKNDPKKMIKSKIQKMIKPKIQKNDKTKNPKIVSRVKSTQPTSPHETNNK